MPMGKRGPATKGEYLGKSAVLSTRITPELRAHLEDAVKRSGLTLSREIEHRLRRTFHEDEKIAEGFGSRRNRALMKMVAMAMQTAWNPDRPDAEWLDDPWMFEQVVRLVNNVLEGARPQGVIPPLSWGPLNAAAELSAMDTPARLWREIQHADASLPLNASGPRHVANLIKSDLGEVASRPQIFEGTAKDFRRKADEMEKSQSRPKRQRLKKVKRK
jgi:hypothetical protein